MVAPLVGFLGMQHVAAELAVLETPLALACWAHEVDLGDVCSDGQTPGCSYCVGQYQCRNMIRATEEVLLSLES